MAGINEISYEVRRRRWNWLGHVLRREGVNECLTALGWTPEGRRARGTPKTTWRRTVERKGETRQGGRVGMYPRQRRGTESVGLRMCRPYEPTGAGRLEDDDDMHLQCTVLPREIIVKEVIKCKIDGYVDDLVRIQISKQKDKRRLKKKCVLCFFKCY